MENQENYGEDTNDYLDLGNEEVSNLNTAFDAFDKGSDQKGTKESNMSSSVYNEVGKGVHDKRTRLTSLETENSEFRNYPNVNIAPNPPPPSPEPIPICHYQTAALDVIEDFYGTYTDYKGKSHQIKRFTWRNYNKLTIQVINFGARIVTMKAPDKNGKVVDILLGYDDLSTQLRYHNFPLGGCIGRCANVVKKSTFSIDNTTYFLTQNNHSNHYHGGVRGFDRVVWTPYVNKSKVIMCYVSEDKEEGYPGQLFVKLTFELCNRNEFRIEYEAQCTRPTIVNLTHLCYLNLAGCNEGAEEIYNHILTLNCNCYTVLDEEKIPTGEIRNVVNSKYDFQIPKCLDKVIGIKAGDGYDQNFCVNTGVERHDCFAARLFHPPSGRMLEIYSSHRGINFTTGNEFGTGQVMNVDKLLNVESKNSATSLIVDHIYKHLTEHLTVDEENQYFELRTLIDLVKGVKLNKGNESLDDIVLTRTQKKYLEKTLQYCSESVSHRDVCLKIKEAIEAILASCKTEPSSTTMETLQLDSEETRKKIMSIITDFMNNTAMNAKYSDNKIHGKHDYVYHSHCGVAVTPGNYPNAINTKGFPNAVLRPGEVYRETTCFKYWIRGGNPNNWIKRKAYEKNYKTKKDAREADIANANAILKAGGL